MSEWLKPDEWAELEEVHNRIIDQRDRMATEEANLRKKLEELEAAKFSMSEMVAGLQSQMETLGEQREQFEEIRYRATHDSLTGLWDRGAILEFLKRELERAERDGGLVGVLIAELDQFKNVKDTYGHVAGDAVLREVAERIVAALPSYDLVGRYGDDYFLVILNGCESESDLQVQAERIRSAVCAKPVQTSAGSIPVTVSVGLASSAGFQGEEAVIRAADAALYRAKRAGGNRVEVMLTA